MLGDDTDRMVKQLKRHEGAVINGDKHEAYQDHLGYLTIGYGRLIDPEIGGGITDAEAEYLLMNDLSNFIRSAKGYSWFDGLNNARKAVVINMLFNLGQPRFDMFVAMHDALERGDFLSASIEMLDSRWARQVQGRSTELAEQMRTGEWQNGN